MQTDATFALVSMLIIAGICFVTGQGSSRKWSVVLMLLGAGVLALWAFWLNDNPLLTRLLPVPNLLFWGNLQLPAAALLAGVAWTRFRGPQWQRMAIVLTLLGIGGFRLLEPILGEPLRGIQDHWNSDVCLQSSVSSCSAAAAATVLREKGIPCQERQLIDLCLTRRSGTTMLGLYRGLRLMTQGKALRVIALPATSEDAVHWPVPAVITIQQPGGSQGWFAVGNRHSVALLDVAGDGSVEIGDPMGGWQLWSKKEFARLYAGVGFGLAK